jgi:hypothetical protein
MSTPSEGVRFALRSFSMTASTDRLIVAVENRELSPFVFRVFVVRFGSAQTASGWSGGAIAGIGEPLPTNL